MSPFRVAVVLLLLSPTASLSGQDRSVDFVHDIAPLLSRYSCNTSSCHGKAEGQNGFKLSVFGNDPRGDFEALTQSGRGRRVMASSPSASLLLRKATGIAPHAGGQRIKKESDAFRNIAAWIETGTPWHNESRAALSDLRIEPSDQVMEANTKLPLQVVATFADGSTQDVTWLSVFHSNNVGMASVTETGVVTTGTTTGQTSVMARYLGKVAVFRALVPRDDQQAGEIETFPQQPVHNAIDSLVDINLQKLRLHPSALCDDATFLRRVHLDLIGKLPTAKEARAFLQDTSPDKRSVMVDSLLERSEYADYWALKWSDLLRVDREKLGRRDAYAYFDWIHRSIAENLPLDEFARTILLAEGPLSENPAGHLFQVSKDSGEIAATVSQVFLGVRIACAQCHQHPYDQWTQQDYHGMRAYFAHLSTKSFGDDSRAVVTSHTKTVKHPRTGNVVHPYPLGTQMPQDYQYDGGSRRQKLADWMTAKENQWFARNMANRIWANLMGRGIVEPVDDVRATNPPSNPELLDLLADHLAQNDFDAKSLIRFIVSSRTYQLSSHPTLANEMDQQSFARAPLKRLPAEVLLDAVCDVTGVREKFTGVPAGYRAIELWDSQTQHYFLRLFGRPARTTPCQCERATGASISQALHLMNSPTLQNKLEHQNGRVAQLVQTHQDDRNLVDELYLTTYSRLPDELERSSAVHYLKQRSNQRQVAAEDLTWSLLNTVEFVFNH